MRYEIQFLQELKNQHNKYEWTSNSVFCRVIACQSNDESKIMSSFIGFCNDFPKVVSRHSIRIFDNYIYDWVVMTRVPDQFEVFNDPICIIWNQHLPSDYLFLEFKQKKEIKFK